MTAYGSTTKLIFDLASQGMTANQIIAATGVPAGTLRTLASRHGLRFGAKRPRVSVHMALPREVDQWLRRQVPQGADLSDLVAAIILDAYNEENEG